MSIRESKERLSSLQVPLSCRDQVLLNNKEISLLLTQCESCTAAVQELRRAIEIAVLWWGLLLSRPTLWLTLSRTLSRTLWLTLWRTLWQVLWLALWRTLWLTTQQTLWRLRKKLTGRLQLTVTLCMCMGSPGQWRGWYVISNIAIHAHIHSLTCNYAHIVWEQTGWYVIHEAMKIISNKASTSITTNGTNGNHVLYYIT